MAIKGPFSYILNPGRFPLTFEMFRLIAHDNGRVNRLERHGICTLCLPNDDGGSRNPNCPLCAGTSEAMFDIAIPKRFEADIPRIEQALKMLTPEERETFAIGEESERPDITRWHLDLQRAHELLEGYFNEWR